MQCVMMSARQREGLKPISMARPHCSILLQAGSYFRERLVFSIFRAPTRRRSIWWGGRVSA